MYMEACAPTCGARTRPRGARSRWRRWPGRGGRCRQTPAQYKPDGQAPAFCAVIANTKPAVMPASIHFI